MPDDEYPWRMAVHRSLRVVCYLHLIQRPAISFRHCEPRASNGEWAKQHLHDLPSKSRQVQVSHAKFVFATAYEIASRRLAMTELSEMNHFGAYIP
jgi:hypothetical protein